MILIATNHGRDVDVPRTRSCAAPLVAVLPFGEGLDLEIQIVK
jgi:hypothetical protein